MTGVHAALEVRIDRKVFQAGDGSGERLVIEGLGFEVPAGEFVCIVGPSGCGKTTMLNIIAALDGDATARVRFADGTSLAQARIGYMFQTPRLLPWATVRENVAIVLDGDAGGDGRVEALLERMELGDCLNEYPNRLSGGMQRRVALARAFVAEPSLLLLDEPFVSLDVPVGNRLRSMLLDLWSARPTTVLFVTHDLREAIYLADRILFLSRGPARVILDTRVPIPRPRGAEDSRIESFRQQLLTQDESLLHGLVSEDAEDTDAPDGQDVDGNGDGANRPAAGRVA
ncbi:MAG TPA: ABC transporter ATP-binding protein [Alphaproteobacteria bacterium]